MVTAKSTESVKQITYLAGALKAPRITEAASRMADQARDAGWSFEDYLAAVLEREVSARNASGAELRIKAAGFPARKTLEDFDWDAQPATRQQIAGLASGGFLLEAQNVVLLGPPGTGKTHLATALGIVAARRRDEGAEMLETSTERGPDWWRHALVYQVYPRSFSDADGDGIGDLRGVLDRVDHFVRLGVDAVWLSPFYPSALADGGYDVDDYRDVAPELGTLADFDALVHALHERGIGVIVDIVPNHSSDRHRDFLAALSAGPGSAERDRYLFRDGAGPDGELPPNDWQSFFGGPAWTRVQDGQWYLHLFTPQQPDWNWANADVRADFLRTLRFWGDRGVDGFRVDVAMCLAKDLTEPYPTWDEVRANLPEPGGLGQANRFGDGRHPFLDRDELEEIYASWRDVFDSYDPPLFAVGETWVESHRRARYANPAALGQAFNFDFLWNPWDPSSFRAVVEENLRLAADAGSTSTWVLSNHDIIRHPTRYADSAVPPSVRINAAIPLSPAARAQGIRRGTAATMLAFALPGSAYMYQGEELGLHEVVDIPETSAQDPQARVVDGFFATRDGSRVPLPWTSEPPFYGFSSSASHLPQPAWFAEASAAAQWEDPASTLALYARALELRRRLSSDDALEWLEMGESVVAFRRSNGWTSITNFGCEEVLLPPGRVLLSSVPVHRGLLPVDATAWMGAAVQGLTPRFL